MKLNIALICLPNRLELPPCLMHASMCLDMLQKTSGRRILKILVYAKPTPGYAHKVEFWK